MPRPPAREGNVLIPVESARNLLQRSWQARHSDVAACRKLAALATAMADRAGDADLQAEAYANLGNAERLSVHYAASEAAFSVAESHWAAGSRAPATAALLWEFRGSLLESVRDYEAAVRALRVAERYRGEIGEPQAIAKVNTHLGIVLGLRGDTQGAIKHLRAAIRGATSEDLLRFAVQPLLGFLTEAGEAEAALLVLRQCDGLIREGPPLYRLKVAWLEGKIFLALGTLAVASEIFTEVRDRYLRGGMVLEAALASLDLALAYARLGRRDQVGAVAGEIEPLLGVLGIAPEAAAARLLRDVAVEEDLEAALGRAAELLLEHDAGRGPAAA